MSKGLLLFLLVSVTAWLVWRNAAVSDLGKDKHSRQVNEKAATEQKRAIIQHDAPKTKSAKITQDKATQLADRAAFIARLAQKPLDHILAEYDMQGDSRHLEAAKLKDPGDPRVLILAALSSKSPNSTSLSELEAAQPENALPNILRAGMYAKAKNWNSLLDEIDRAEAKSSLTLSGRERKAAVLDILIENGGITGANTIFPKADQDFFRAIETVVTSLENYPEAFGGTTQAASIGIKLAETFQRLEDYDFWSMARAEGIELQLLQRLDPGLPYGDTGNTVGQRFKELNSGSAQKWAEIYGAVFQASTDATTRMQFFTRMRADGEMAALQWFDEKQADRAVRR